MGFIYTLPFGWGGVGVVAQVHLTFMNSLYNCPSPFFILDGKKINSMKKKVLTKFAKDTFDKLGRKYSTNYSLFFLPLSTHESQTLYFSPGLLSPSIHSPHHATPLLPDHATHTHTHTICPLIKPNLFQYLFKNSAPFFLIPFVLNF